MQTGIQYRKTRQKFGKLHHQLNLHSEEPCIKMSDRYCIDKILEKPKQDSPETSEDFADDNDVIHEKELSLIQERSEERRIHDKRNSDLRNYELKSPDGQQKSSVLVHVPRDVPRPYSSDPYRHISSLCYPRVARCYCPGCSQESVPPWLRRAQSPQFVSVDKRLGPRAYIHHPYSIRGEQNFLFLAVLRVFFAVLTYEGSLTQEPSFIHLTT